MHEVVEVTKLLSSLYLCGCFLRERCDACNLQHHGTEPFSRERLRRVLRKKAAVILYLHTFTPANLHRHTFTSADLHLHTLTPADLHLHTFTPADLDLYTLTSADLDLHTLTPADLDLHTLTSADLHLHTFTSANLLSLFIYSLLRRRRCRRSATKRNPFARNGRRTSKT